MLKLSIIFLIVSSCTTSNFKKRNIEFKPEWIFKEHGEEQEVLSCLRTPNLYELRNVLLQCRGRK